MHEKPDVQLRRTLQTPQPPSSLRRQLHANLRLQRDAERRTHCRGGAMAAVAALLLMLTVFAGSRWPSAGAELSAVIAAARQHAQDEAAMREVDPAALSSWLQSLDAGATASPRLVLFKTCVVDGVAVKHLRVRLDSGGTADFMVDASGQWRALPASRAKRGWLVAHPRANVSMVAVFTPNQEMGAIRAMEAMFPGWHSSSETQQEV